jgi:hypothetical protein
MWIAASFLRGDVTTMIPRHAVQYNSNTRSVTNRHRSPSHSEDRESLEAPLIDTIRLSGPIHKHMIPHWQMKISVDDNGEIQDRFTSTRVNTGDFELQVRVARNGEMEAVVERSLPTLRYGHNIDAVNVSTAVRVVNDIYDRASDFVEWAVDVDELRIRRLDLDRDFDGVAHLDHLLRGLARLHVPRTANSSVFSDNEHHGGALTLTRSVRDRWRASLYDKHAQVSHLARHQRDPLLSARMRERAAETQGRVRFEVQLRSKALRERGLNMMSDLDNAILLDLCENYFDRAQFGTPVGGAPHVDAVIARLATTSDSNYKSVGAVLFMLKAEALNLPQPTTSSATLAKYRKLAREWGLSAADMSGLAGPPVALDFERGNLRVA